MKFQEISKPCCKTKRHYKLIHRKCVSSQEISEEFRLPFIINGYRYTNRSFFTYLKSVGYLNNETANFWTHFIPFLFTLVYHLKLAYGPIMNDPFYLPYFRYLQTVTLYLFLSSSAHMLYPMSSTTRHVCFILDYLGN